MPRTENGLPGCGASVRFERRILHAEIARPLRRVRNGDERGQIPRRPAVPCSPPPRSSDNRATAAGGCRCSCSRCPGSCAASECDTPRRIANLSAHLASLGRCSQISMPATLVSIGLNSPRIFGGGVGLEVEGVHVRRAAAQIDVDRRATFGGSDFPGLRHPQVTGKRKTEAADRPDLKEIAAMHAVAELMCGHGDGSFSGSRRSGVGRARCRERPPWGSEFRCAATSSCHTGATERHGDRSLQLMIHDELFGV